MSPLPEYAHRAWQDVRTPGWNVPRRLISVVAVSAGVVGFQEVRAYVRLHRITQSLGPQQEQSRPERA
jgi:hypothetical protein